MFIEEKIYGSDFSILTSRASEREKESQVLASYGALWSRRSTWHFSLHCQLLWLGIWFICGMLNENGEKLCLNELWVVIVEQVFVRDEVKFSTSDLKIVDFF